MMCAWKELLEIIPQRLTRDVDRIGRDSLTELRLRCGYPAELVMGTGFCRMGPRVTRGELECCVNFASRYSPWAASTVSRGFLTARGGHRIGLCGEAVVKNGKICAIKELSSICIRVARDFPGVGSAVVPFAGSMLLVGSPGCGKTTLLRDIARQISARNTVAVVDERAELFPEGMERGIRMDVLTGCSKHEGIEMMLRCMGPEYIAVDEITSGEDTAAILEAYGSGIKLLATAHAGSLEEYRSRVIYRQLIENEVFDSVVILSRDKSYRVERIKDAV